MSEILFDLSGKLSPPIIDAVYNLKKVADSLNIPLIIVGATARDIIFEHRYKIKSSRATKDIDLGIEVADWDQFHMFSKALLETGKFSSTEEKQRFQFGATIIDIIPFGSITDEHKKISWPPEHEIIMSMLGFKEAYEYCLSVRLNTEPELIVKLSSLPGLALLKIISWQDNYPNRRKDAEDLLFIMKKYSQAGNEPRLYEEELPLLQEEGADPILAGIRLLGRDMAKISDRDTMHTISEILKNETGEQSRYRLVEDMISSVPSKYDFDEILNDVEKLKQGFFETVTT